MRHSGPAFERRINRDFPNTFVSLLKDADLAYQLVDMEQPFGQLLNWFRQQINS
jgi:hypothetical protein